MGKVYTEEQIINRVILLHYRYNDNAIKMAKAEGLSRLSLSRWKDLYLAKAIDIVGLEEKEAKVTKDITPTPKALYEKLLREIEVTSNPQSVAHLATALNKLHQIMKEEGDTGDNDKQWQDIKAKLLNK